MDGEKLSITNVFVVSDFMSGVVESADDHTLTILKEEWAPAIWAGAENCTIAVKPANSEFYKCSIIINFVNLQNRSMYYLGPKVEAGDRLYLTMRIEDGR